MPLVAYAYEHMYKEPLKKRLESETSGNLEDLLVSLCLPIVEREARQLRNAIKGSFSATMLYRFPSEIAKLVRNFQVVRVVVVLFSIFCVGLGSISSGAGTDEGCLVDVICTKPAGHLRVLIDTYNKMYKRSLVDDCKNDLSGDFKKLILALLDCSRSEVFDPATCDADAGALYKAGEGKIGTDGTTIMHLILSIISFLTLIRSLFHATLYRVQVYQHFNHSQLSHNR